MTKENAFLGLPTDFNQKFLIYPPKIKEIVSNKKFYQYRQILTFSQEELDDEYVKKNIIAPTPYEFLLGNSFHSEEFEQIAKEAFFFFIKQEVTFLYEEKLILIGKLEEELKRVKSFKGLVFLTEDEYFDFIF